MIYLIFVIKWMQEAEKVRWRFYGYETPAKGRPVQEWFEALLQEEKDEALDTLGYLQVLPLKSWGKPEYEPLGDGLSEIRFKVSSLNRTYRIYGFFWPAGSQHRHSYTFLLGKEKKVKNDKLGIEESRDRKRRVERREASAHEFKFS